MGRSDTVGYTFKAENLCVGHTLTAMRANGIKVGAGGADAIRKAAENLGVDMDDLRSYDSGDFPKPLTEDECRTDLPDGRDYPDALRKRSSGIIADEQCGATGCGKWLKLGEKSPSGITLARKLRGEYEFPQPIAGDVTRKLREWGLTHPDYIDSEDVRAAVATVPHDYRAVRFTRDRRGTGFHYTPEHDGEECFDCELPYETHTVRCAVCKANVNVVDPHTHTIPMRGQQKLKF